MNLKFRHILLPCLLCAEAAFCSDASIAEDDDFGSYLAGRNAAQNFKFHESAEFHRKSLDANPNELHLLEIALPIFIGAGDLDSALDAAGKLAELDVDSEWIVLIRLVDDFVNQRYSRAAERAAARLDGHLIFSDIDQVISLIAHIAIGWSQFGAGGIERAVDAFEAIPDEAGFKAHADFHQALAWAIVGDFRRSSDILSQLDKYYPEINNEILVAHAQVLAQLEQREIAGATIAERIPDDNHAVLEILDHLHGRLEGEEPIDFDFVTTPQQGMREAFATVARYFSIREYPDPVMALMFARLAEMLDQENGALKAFIGDRLLEQGNYDSAGRAYNSVPDEHPQKVYAEISRAQAAYSSNDLDGAVGILRALSKVQPDNPRIDVEIGSLYRYASRFQESLEAMDTAIDKASVDGTPNWVMFYYRGIANERLGNWEEAKADFKEALRINPDSPHAMNYLGYSLVEKRESLDEAETLIRGAVDADPDNGAFVDSLAWVLYRLGRFDEAVPIMERALRLEPTDPVVIDHMGDVYWMVGRNREARFQWIRALSFNPEKVEEERILRKIEVGLDAVLKEESGTAVQSE